MRNICIFLFSGTGMTQYVIEHMKAAFEKSDTIVELKYIEHCSSVRESQLSGYEAIGIAYPVHAFNAPKIVVDFAKQLPQSHYIPTFLIATAGEQSKVNYASSHLLRKVLQEKGFDVFYERLFAMPSNFAMKYDETEVQELLDAANVDTCKAVDEISNNCPAVLPRSFISNIFTFLGRVEWFGAKMSGLFFYTDQSCRVCGLCEKHCPNQNIKITKNDVKFGLHCGLCMRCLYLCPYHAIKIRRPFRFIAFDRWYENPALKIPGKQ